MRVVEKRLMTNQEAFLQLSQERSAAASRNAEESQSELEQSLEQWLQYLQAAGLAGGQVTGTEGTESIRAMLGELASFPALTRQEKFNLVNLPEVTIDAAKGSSASADTAALCDICLVVPAIRDWNESSEVTRLCQIVYRYKRVHNN